MALTVRFTPGYNWTVGEVVTEEKLALAANPTVELEGTVGTASVGDGSITLPKLAVGILTADAAGRSRMVDGFMTTAKYGDSSVTAVKLGESARGDVHQYASGVYSAGVYAMSLPTAPTAYTEGMRIAFKADSANDNSGSGSADVNVNSLGAKNLYSRDGKELAWNQIIAGTIVTAVYNGTAFLTDLPSRYSAPTASAPALPGAGSVEQVAHGLGVAPYRFQVFLYCSSNDAATGYTSGAIIPPECYGGSSAEPFFAVTADATNVNARQNGSTLKIAHKTTGVFTTVTSGANFKILVRAEL